MFGVNVAIVDITNVYNLEQKQIIIDNKICLTAFNYGFGKNRTVEVCNSVYDQLVYIAIGNKICIICFNCCSSVTFSITITYLHL